MKGWSPLKKIRVDHSSEPCLRSWVILFVFLPLALKLLSGQHWCVHGHLIFSFLSYPILTGALGWKWLPCRMLWKIKEDLCAEAPHGAAEHPIPPFPTHSLLFSTGAPQGLSLIWSPPGEEVGTC